MCVDPRNFRNVGSRWPYGLAPVRVGVLAIKEGNMECAWISAVQLERGWLCAVEWEEKGRTTEVAVPLFLPKCLL